MKLKNRAVALVGVLALLSLGACGSGSKTASDEYDSGDTLVIADETQPLSGLDPIMAQAHDAKRVVSQLYEGLLRLGEDGRTVEPALASDWEMKSPTVYEFQLREGVTFHDGSELTAADVVFSLERVIDPDQNSPYRSLYRIKSVTAPAEDRVVIELSRPQASLPRLLAQPWSGGIVNQKWVESVSEDEIKTQANGTGPYRLDQFKEGSTISTSAFEDYWDGAPEIKTVEYRVMPDESTRVQALRSGAIHMTQIRLTKNKQELEKSGYEMGESYFVGSYWLALNMKEGPLSDERVRRAVSLGVDRNQLIEIGSQGSGVPSGAVPPGDPFGSDTPDDMPYYEHDVEEAKRLLAEAGAKNVKLTLAIRSDSPEKIATAQLVKEQLAEIGVKVEIRQVEWSRLVSSILSGDWNADMVQLTAALNADPSQYLDLWFAEGGAATKVDDEALWQMMDEAVEGDLSDEERTDAYAAINHYIAEQAYILVPYASVQVWETWTPGLDFKAEPSNTRLLLHKATAK
ncbi:ABC transporter substrate-binding protein [Nocardioides alcanivorans]|uniref:ABC transporter substrate-binding protein n=1 Tax=Nocardioides alcanivorans TaxID=2897352 RepID=UPI001F18AC94|nr:ABC transporter substrate-binding protein [Nocardioides alcanivorans]